MFIMENRIPGHSEGLTTSGVFPNAFSFDLSSLGASKVTVAPGGTESMWILPSRAAAPCESPVGVSEECTAFSAPVGEWKEAKVPATNTIDARSRRNPRASMRLTKPAAIKIIPTQSGVAGRTAMKVIFNNYTPHTPKWVSVHSSRSFLPLTVHSALLFMSGYLPSETLRPVPPCAQPRQMKLQRRA